MANLKKITEKLYKYTGEKTGGIYTLLLNCRGRNYEGKAYFLWAQYPNMTTDICVASFCVKDDCYQCYKEDYLGKLWTNVGEIIREANKLIDKMEEA